ncbi:MAG TPA: sulfatase [Thermoanaerobaculia bacterium]|jgi:arylsulfatase A-like enzyme|nr:sulfatase [Thermoanaerobaculia bacterium]
MTRRTISLVVLLLALGLCGNAGCAKPAPRPNVIFILLDTLRSDRLSSYGYPKPTTPNLDAFAKEGVLFEQARSQASCTFPSVNSILTSRWPLHFLGQPEDRIGIPKEYVTLQEILGQSGYQTIAVTASPIVRRSPSHHNLHGGFERGFDVFDETCHIRRANCVNRRTQHHLNRLAKGPFFLYLHYMDVHSAYIPPSPFKERFVEPYPEARPWILMGNPRPIRRSLTGEGRRVEMSARDVAYMSGLYDGELAYLDDQLRQLFADLKERGLLDSSIVVVAADHGEEFMEHGRMIHCEVLYDTSVHVPLIVRLPPELRPRGAKASPRIAALVENLDLTPTILDYLGMKPPTPLDGVSLRPLIEQGTPLHDTSFALQYALRSATDGRSKLIFDQGSGRFELHDMATDRLEQKDVLAAQRRTYFALRKKLEARMTALEGGFATAGSLAAAREGERQLKALGYLQ